MIGNRSILALFLAVSFVAMILLGFADKFDSKAMCKSAQAGLTDKCAKTGGFSR